MLKQLKTFREVDPVMFSGDTSIAWFQDCTVKRLEHMEWDGKDITSYGTGDNAIRFILMWREIKNWVYQPAFAKTKVTFDRYYNILPMQWGPSVMGREDIITAIDYYSRKGYNLMYSTGPMVSPQSYITYKKTAAGAMPVMTNVAQYMKKMPEDWAEWNLKVAEYMDQDLGATEQNELVKQIINSNAALMSNASDKMAQVANSIMSDIASQKLTVKEKK